MQQSGIEEEDDRGKALLLYGTDTLYTLSPRKSGPKYCDLGASPDQDIVISSPYVSARHCRIYPTRLGVKVVDQKSKTSLEFRHDGGVSDFLDAVNASRSDQRVAPLPFVL